MRYRIAWRHDYLLLGIRHIWEGSDHLLFVAGLLMLARIRNRPAPAKFRGV